MQSKYTNKNGVKLLAAIMAFAMVFVAGFAIIGENGTSVDAATGENIKYFSGTLDGLNEVPNKTIAYVDKDTVIKDNTDNSTYGSIVVRSGGYLKINSDVTLTIENATTGTFSYSSDTISTNGHFGGLVIENGAYVIIDGTVIVKDDGSIINNNSISSSGTIVQDSYAGTIVNGKITVDKGGNFLASTSKSGEVAVLETGSVEFKSTTLNPSTLTLQTFKIMEGSKLKIDATVSGLNYVESFAGIGDSYGITSKVALSGQNTVATSLPAYANIFPATPSTQGPVNLSFGVTSENAGKLYSSGTATNKFVYYYLDVSGTVGDGAVLTNMSSYIDTLKFPTSTGTESNYKVYGVTQVSDSLKVTKGGSLCTIGLSNLFVSGTIDVEGVKGTSANVYLGGNHFITGEVNVGEITKVAMTNATTITQRTTANDADITVYFGIHKDAYFNVTENGSVNLDGYTIDSTNYYNCPGGVLGVYYTDDDGVFHIVADIETAMDAVLADNNSELTVSAYKDYGDYLKGTQYAIKSDVTIPEGMEITLHGILAVDKKATFTLSEGADIRSTGGQGGVIKVSGYFYDYNISTLTYGTIGTDGTIDTGATVKVNAEVKSIDSDETYCLYTTLGYALAVEGKAKIDLFGDATISGTVTIPEDKTVDTKSNKITVGNDSELIVDGVIYISASDTTNGKIVITKEVVSNYVTTKQAGIVTVNNMIVCAAGDIKITTGSTPAVATKELAGFYASGTIGDYKNKSFILAPAIAAENSETIGTMTVEAKTVYTGDLTFKAKENATNATIDIKAEAVFGKVILDGYKITNDINGNKNEKLSATIIAETTAGESSIILDKVTTDKMEFYVYKDESGDSPVNKFMIKNDANVKVLKGSITIASGVVYIETEIHVGTLDSDGKHILTVGSDAELIIPENSKVEIVKKTLNNVKDFPGLVIDGKLSVKKGALTADGTSTAGKALINGELYLSNGTKTFAGVLEVIGTVVIETEGTDKATLAITGNMILGEASDTLGTTATISGAVSLSSTGQYIIAYPGADLSAALINVDSTGVSSAKKTDYFINGELYMTTYAFTGQVIKNMIPTPIEIVGYEDVKYVADTDRTDSLKSSWYVIPEMDSDSKLLVDTDTVDNYSAIYAKAIPSTAYVGFSVGTGISLWIDGVKCTSGSVKLMNVGEYNVEATIDPGYKGTAKIVFNGVEITNGKMVITPQMSVDSTYTTPVIISATGNITSDAGTVIIPEDKDSGMGITDYLLIVLVILAAILVVIVAIRMMRS